MANKAKTKMTTKNRDLAILWYMGFVLFYGFISYQFFAEFTLQLFCVLFCIGAIATLVSSWSQGVQWPSLLLFLTLGFTLVMFFSLFYAYSPSHAYREIQKYMSALSAFTMAFALVSRDRKNIRRLFWMLLILLSVHTFLSIETASTRFLLSPVIHYIRGQSEYLADIYGFWNGTRMLTLLNPNVTAPLNLIGIFLVRYLYQETENKKQKRILFGISCLLAMGFILCVSVGSILVGIVIVLLNILSYGKKGAADALLYHTFVFGIGLVFAAVAYLGMGYAFPRCLLSVLSAVFCPITGFFAQAGFRRLTALADKRKWIVLEGNFGIIALYALLAILLTAPLSVDGEKELRRIAAAQPGENELTIHTDGKEAADSLAVKITCVSFSDDTNMETTLDTFELIPVSSQQEENVFFIQFEAPKGTQATRITFDMGGQYQINRMTLRNKTTETEENLALSHVLIPEFVYQRLHGLSYNQSASSRFMFFQDAWEIIKQSPLWGLGAGSFETKSMQVQNTYYESKYVHSHYLQTWLETGMIGLLLYISLIGYAMFLLLKSWKARQNKSLAIALFSALCLVVAHTFIDFDMSFEWFLLVVWMLLAVIAVVFDKALPLPKAAWQIQKVVLSVIPGFMILLCIGTWIASANLNKIVIQQQQGKISIEDLSTTVKSGIVLDFPHAVEYKANYIAALTGKNIPSQYRALLHEYVADLEKITDRSAVICEVLIDYAVSENDYLRALEYAQQMPQSQIMNAENWNKAFAVCCMVLENGDEKQKDAALQAIANLQDALNKVNRTAKPSIEIELKNCGDV